MQCYCTAACNNKVYIVNVLQEFSLIYTSLLLWIVQVLSSLSTVKVTLRSSNSVLLSGSKDGAVRA